MIKTFKSTGIGNEIPFDAAEAERWRRMKAKTREALDERQGAGEGKNPSSFEERPGDDLDGS